MLPSTGSFSAVQLPKQNSKALDITSSTGDFPSSNSGAWYPGVPSKKALVLTGVSLLAINALAGHQHISWLHVLWWQWTRALVTQRRRKINLLTALRHSQPEQQPSQSSLNCTCSTSMFLHYLHSCQQVLSFKFYYTPPSLSGTAKDMLRWVW